MNGLSLIEAQRAIESELRTLTLAGGRESDPTGWDQLQLLAEALKDLPTSWREPHPGVFKPTWTFVTDLQYAYYHGDADGVLRIEGYRRAHLDTVVDNLESARRGVSLDDGGDEMLVPLLVRVCGEDQVATDSCRSCGCHRPLVLRSDIGTGCDLGRVETKAYILCLTCRRLTLVGKKLETIPDLSR